jgi:hypothetical protein
LCEKFTKSSQKLSLLGGPIHTLLSIPGVLGFLGGFGPFGPTLDPRRTFNLGPKSCHDDLPPPHNNIPTTLETLGFRFPSIVLRTFGTKSFTRGSGTKVDRDSRTHPWEVLERQFSLTRSCYLAKPGRSTLSRCLQDHTSAIYSTQGKASSWCRELLFERRSRRVKKNKTSREEPSKN